MGWVLIVFMHVEYDMLKRGGGYPQRSRTFEESLPKPEAQISETWPDNL